MFTVLKDKDVKREYIISTLYYLFIHAAELKDYFTLIRTMILRRQSKRLEDLRNNLHYLHYFLFLFFNDPNRIYIYISSYLKCTV